ncbi:MAG TPA: 4-hydroxythreonine-4-phosphate dehydrogenase PdxA, partial [Caulobacteraceae bacterium]|nr:4-hydroxythreonine-4-phosphate dehydrogenase PdxA [Caulobacteraceae bacterium]
MRRASSSTAAAAVSGLTAGRPLAATLGDPAGIGPEILAKAWRALGADGPRFFVIGDARALSAWAPVRTIDGPSDVGADFADALHVLDLPLAEAPTPGEPTSEAAPRIVNWIETAVRLALSGQAAGVVTAPIAKTSLYAGGFKH